MEKVSRKISAGEKIGKVVLLVMLTQFLYRICTAEVTDSMPPCTSIQNNIHCVQYIANSDGNKIMFKISPAHPSFGRWIEVQLSGIDVPDMDAESSCESLMGIKAKTLVNVALFKAKNINLINVKRVKHRGIIARVEFDGKRLSPLLLNARVARPYSGKKKSNKKWCD